MEGSLRLVFNLATTAFLAAWGAYERISAVRTARKHAGSADRDRRSLIVLYVAIWLGYGIGIPAAFTGYGKLVEAFPYLPVAGLPVVLAGLAIRLAAKRALAEQFTYTVRIIDDHRLITSGIYSRIRHPSYLGQSMIFLGCGMAFSNWVSVLILFLPSFVATLYRISVEESVLLEQFPERYGDYMRKTKLLIPWMY